jgi:hypothetical protein
MEKEAKKLKKDRVVRKALAEAKKLEAEPVPTKEELAKFYKEGMQEAETLRKLLEPSWFIKDIHVEKKKKKTRKKKKSL